MNNKLRNKPQVKRQRKAAVALRRQHNLCEHADDERACADDAEAERVAALPPVVCETCGKARLRVALITKKPTEDVQLKDILR